MITRFVSAGIVILFLCIFTGCPERNPQAAEQQQDAHRVAAQADPNGSVNIVGTED